MIEFRYQTYVDTVPHGVNVILVGDIGGTNANFAFFELHDGAAHILFSMHCKSQKIERFIEVVHAVLAYAKDTYALEPKTACFAVAGVVSKDRDRCKPTNLNFVIDTKEIIAQTGIRCAYLVNDFEIIGYGLHKIAPKDLVAVHKGNMREHANKVILGAGTGLGKCILAWDKHLGRHLPLASEGGHADFAAQSPLDFDLITFLHTYEQKNQNISWEDVLSGDGIKRIYAFFRQRNHRVAFDPALARSGPNPDEIFSNRHRDEHAFNTFMLYTTYYARCAKNFALDGLAIGGVYIAGGIAAKNLPLFEQEAFLQEFFNCGKQHALLREIPIFVITDYDISLYGVAEFLIVEKMCEV